jgi:hypothetical protein
LIEQALTGLWIGLRKEEYLIQIGFELAIGLCDQNFDDPFALWDLRDAEYLFATFAFQFDCLPMDELTVLGVFTAFCHPNLYHLGVGVVVVRAGETHLADVAEGDLHIFQAEGDALGEALPANPHTAGGGSDQTGGRVERGVLRRGSIQHLAVVRLTSQVDQIAHL